MSYAKYPAAPTRILVSYDPTDKIYAQIGAYTPAKSSELKQSLQTATPLHAYVATLVHPGVLNDKEISQLILNKVTQEQFNSIIGGYRIGTSLYGHYFSEQTYANANIINKLLDKYPLDDELLGHFIASSVDISTYGKEIQEKLKDYMLSNGMDVASLSKTQSGTSLARAIAFIKPLELDTAILDNAIKGASLQLILDFVPQTQLAYACKKKPNLVCYANMDKLRQSGVAEAIMVACPHEWAKNATEAEFNRMVKIGVDFSSIQPALLMRAGIKDPGGWLLQRQIKKDDTQLESGDLTITKAYRVGKKLFFTKEEATTFIGETPNTKHSYEF